MELTHSFTVPAPRERAWAAFGDVAAVAECFPGATVTSVEGDDFTGSCKVKLGPIALVYAGSGRFLQRDETSGRMLLEAKGKDKRGNGTAGAKVSVSFRDSGGSSTYVEVVTDLQVTGKPAQFGRGVIQDVSDKLLQQFVTCLEQRIGAAGSAATVASPGAEEPAGAEESAGAGASGEEPSPSPSPDPGPEPEPGPAPVPAPDTGAQPEPEQESATPPHGDPLKAATGVGGSGTATVTELPRREQPSAQDDALDLGSALLPVLVRSYGKRAATGLGAFAVLVVLSRLLRRRG